MLYGKHPYLLFFFMWWRILCRCKKKKEEEYVIVGWISNDMEPWYASKKDVEEWKRKELEEMEDVI